jgi:hypothetical protein
MLRRPNLSHISATLAETVLQAAQANLSHEAFLHKLAAPERAVSPGWKNMTGPFFRNDLA